MRTLLKNGMLAAGLLLGASLHAQDADDTKKTPEERAKHRTEEMTRELGLTADQAAKVDAINLKYTQPLVDLKNSDADKDAKKQQAKDLKDRRDADLKGVLTPEQYSKMLNLRREKMAEHKGAHKDKKPHNE